jgi:hypothetical protein
MNYLDEKFNMLKSMDEKIPKQLCQMKWMKYLDDN